MAGVDDEASEGALAEEATIVLFRNPETTGFGALCQRIAASTTLEVCVFASTQRPRAPAPCAPANPCRARLRSSSYSPS